MMMGKKRIVLVEDNEVYATAIDYMFKDSLEFNMTVCTSAEEFLKLGELPDLLIVDQQLPGMTGLSLIRKVRFTDPDTPIIMLTGYENPELYQAAKDMGVGVVLRKCRDVIGNLQYHLENEFRRDREKKRASRFTSYIAAASLSLFMLMDWLS